MKQEFAFITIIITVYHFMYSHLVSFKCKSGHWTAHIVTHSSLTMMIQSRIGRENIRAPLPSLRENNRFDLCLFSWKPCTQQNKKKKKLEIFIFLFKKTNTATVWCSLCYFSVCFLLPNLNKKNKNRAKSRVNYGLERTEELHEVAASQNGITRHVVVVTWHNCPSVELEDAACY